MRSTWEGSPPASRTTTSSWSSARANCATNPGGTPGRSALQPAMPAMYSVRPLSGARMPWLQPFGAPSDSGFTISCGMRLLGHELHDAAVLRIRSAQRQRRGGDLLGGEHPRLPCRVQHGAPRVALAAAGARDHVG